ncbi:MAG: transpeptidase family protein [Ignavibacteriales bacterium]|nr:transpeptidase family protein [Ignavibacteriales bacterium]
MTIEQQQKLPAYDIGDFHEKKSRLRFVRILLFVFFGVIAMRLLQVQIIESPKYKEIAQKQYQAKFVLPASRGILYDRKGNVLASNSQLVSFAADPKIAAEDADDISKKFSKVFGKPKSHYLQELKSDTRFVWLERMVDVKYLKEIDVKKMIGVIARYETKRIYYNDYLAGQLIGVANIDNSGISGIEQQYDNELRGADGYVVFQRDGLRRARPSVDYPRVEPRDGNNIYLTIDIQLQAIAEKELKKGVEKSKVDRGLVIMMQPQTGEILAIAQYPKVDPNNFGKYEMEDRRLRAFTDMFEPGSVFKIVTASAAIEHNLVKPESKFNAEKGLYKVYISANKKPREIIDAHKAEILTFQEAIEMSSNIVMAKISDIIGAERFYKMARDYGFGIATNIEYPGELNGVLKKPINWSATSLNTMAFGYEVGVTPLQIVCAYAAVANDGVLMKPLLFKKEVDANGVLVRESKPQKIRNVISHSTCQELTKFLEGVVDRGTATSAKVNGVRIAGKTGTSKKMIDGKYTTGEYIASFVGFFPIEDPQIVCLVMMDKPKGESYYGGLVSAPVFRGIAEQVIATTDVTSRLNSVVASADSGSVSSEIGKKKTIQASDLVPDVRGLSLRKAIETLKTQGLIPVVNGSGTVSTQTPLAGIKKKRGMRVTLICQQKSDLDLGMNDQTGNRR